MFRYIGGVKRGVKMRFVDGKFMLVRRHRPMTGINRARFLNRTERGIRLL